MARVVVESLTVVVVYVVFSGLAWALFADLYALRIISLIVLFACAVAAIAAVAKNPPLLMLANNTLRVYSYPLGIYGEMGKAKQLENHLENVERVWVGKARDYPSGLLVNHLLYWRGFPRATVMVIWLKGENNPYLVREFSWLSRTAEFLEQLRASGIRVENGSLSSNPK